MFDTATLLDIQNWATEVLSYNDPASNADLLDMLSVYTQQEKRQLWDWLTINNPLLKARLTRAAQPIREAS